MIDPGVIIHDYMQGKSTRSRLVSLLRDFYPAEKKYVNLAITVYDIGIADRISQMTEMDSMQKHVFVKQKGLPFKNAKHFTSE